MQRFRSIDRESELATPISIQDCLPEGHLARYIVENLDLYALEQRYAGCGHEVYPPSLLLVLLIYTYATDLFSTRKIERATYESFLFRYMACNLPPDHDTLATFRQRFKKAFEEIFVHILRIARENGLRDCLERQSLKISGSFRTLEGAPVCARLQAVISTFRKRGGNVFARLRELFSPRAAPFKWRWGR